MIRIASFLAADLGLGQHALQFGKALRRYETTQLVCWNRGGRAGLAGDLLLRCSRNSAGVSMGAIERTFLLRTRFRIPYHIHETTRVPAPHRYFLERADMVWTPTAWGRDVLAQNSIPPERIRIVPEGVDAVRFAPAPEPEAAREVFRFLCVAKWEERKGTADLVRSFAREFAPHEPVELVLHCGKADVRSVVYGELLTGGSARVIVNDVLPPDGMPGLMRQSDAFVLPTRGEGWGLPVLEAMACGLPCIVTDHGAVREFAHNGNCWLIRVSRMVRVRDPKYYDPDWDWGEWAEPDVEHLQHLMRFVYEHREAAHIKARQARRDAAELWSWDHAARQAMKHLRELRGR